jgi:hypothetical protein
LSEAEEKILPGILLIREDNTSEEVVSLQQVPSKDKSHTRLLLKASNGEYVYPGSHEAIQKVIIKLLEGSKVDFQIFTDLGDMTAVVDPKRTSAAAMRLLKQYHEQQVKDQFLHRIFRDGYVVLPDTEILSVRTDKGKVFTFWRGQCWEITPTNQLISVVRIPDQKVAEVYLGTFRLSHSEYTFVSHSAYAQDATFEEMDGADQ